MDASNFSVDSFQVFSSSYDNPPTLVVASTSIASSSDASVLVLVRLVLLLILSVLPLLLLSVLCCLGSLVVLLSFGLSVDNVML